MSCCPPAPVITIGGSPDTTTGIADNPMLRGESAECYMATANNPTGKQDDATGNVENKIDNAQIPMKADGTVDIIFKMQDTPASPTKRTPTRWEIKDDAGQTPAWLHPAANNLPQDPGYNHNDPVRVDNDNYSSGPTLHLHGTFRTRDFKQQFRCTVAAFDATGEIDNKGYVFSPDGASNASDNIQLTHPLPGAICNSRFSAQRLHPVYNIVKPHNGCDFKYEDRHQGDVVAAADGEVIFSAYSSTAGNWVKVKHLNGAGKHLCTTVYMHLDKSYVQVGQKVSAGQKIAKEGTTGSSTGNHLHFECRLPNDTPIDPLPLIKGSNAVATQTDASNNAVPGKVEVNNFNAVLTPANVDAKTSGCAAFGPNYPTPTAPDAATVTPAPVPTTNDPFELAWNLTLKTEVSGWTVTPPTVQSTLDGLIDTVPHKKAVGFVNHPADPGGTTKFGVAQKFNKGMNIEDVKYQNARDVAYSKYWQGKPSSLAATKPRCSIAAFNIGYLCGPGGLNSIINSANIGSLSDSAAVDPLCDAFKAYLLNKVKEDPKKSVFQNGWMNRVETVRQYAKSVSV